MSLDVRQPLFDVVIPNHDQPVWLELCVRALEGFTKNPIRIIVVDNASTDPAMVKLLREIENRTPTGAVTEYKVVWLAENRSFSNSVNAGVRAGNAPLICILNNDALVQNGWDTSFASDLAAKEVGMVGAKSNAASGLQSDSTGANAFVEPKYLVFVCVALRREVWDQVGPMDEERFNGFGSEDLDYSWTIRKSGGRLKISNAYVLHGFSQTLAKTVGGLEARRANDFKQQTKLVEKWGLDWVKKETQVLPKIFVATFSAEETTRVQFMEQVIGLRKGTGFDFQFVHVTRLPIHLARESVAKTALQHGFDYLMMLDDDHLLPNDLIPRLLSHKKDVVCALAYGRKAPYTTCVYSLGEDGIHGNEMVGIEHTGLRKVDISGFAVSLIKTEVFKKLKEKDKDKPFFHWDGKVGEDFYMCARLRDASIPLHVDTDLIVPHIGSATIIDEAFKKNWLAAQPK